MSVCMYVCVYVCMCVYVFMHVCTYARMHAHTHICMYECMEGRICMWASVGRSPEATRLEGPQSSKKHTHNNYNHGGGRTPK